MEGREIGNYRVVSKLGEGGMGVVYLAEHPRIGRKAAIKFVKPDHAEKSESIERFATEAWAANSIGHPNIVEIFDFGALPEGDVYIVMEYLEGETLSTRLKRAGPLPIPHALQVGWQMATGLEAAHAKGIVHRDLKPDNLFLVRDKSGRERVKILDFGIAKLLDPLRVSTLHTRTGSLMGTPVYSSPEQLLARPIDHRTDIYALGLILYQMLCGRPPFMSEALGELVNMHLSMPPPSAREVNSAVSKHLDQIIFRALEKDRERRFPDMGAVAAALAADPSWPGPVDLGTPAPALTSKPVPLLLSEVTRKADRVARTRRRRSWLVVGGVALALAVAVALAPKLAGLWRQRPAAIDRSVGPATLNTPDPSPDEAARAYLDAAEQLAAGGRFSSALAMLEKARALKVKSAPVNIRLARVGDAIETQALARKAAQLLEAGELDTALDAAKAALDRDSSNAEALAVLTAVRNKREASGPKARTAAVDKAPAPRTTKGALSATSAPADPASPNDRASAPNEEPGRAVEAAPAAAVARPAPDASAPRTPAGTTVATSSPKGAAPAARSTPRPSGSTPAAVFSTPPKDLIPPPSLPRARTGSPRDLAPVLREVEAQAVSLAGVSPEFARDVTAPLLAALSAKDEATIYPAALYYLIVREAGMRHDKATAARSLKNAHFGGGLRGLLDLPTGGR